jgi:hypothetical protein
MEFNMDCTFIPHGLAAIRKAGIIGHTGYDESHSQTLWASRFSDKNPEG